MASTATIFPIAADSSSNGEPVTAASPMIGAPSAPLDTGAVFPSGSISSHCWSLRSDG
jgi:hypothetical protein